MPFHYFLSIPKLPTDVSDQSNAVEVVVWLVGEGETVTRGQPVARVQTRWAVIDLLAAGTGIVGKQIFDPGTHVRIGDPLAVIYADGDELPYGREPVELRVAEVRQVKPRRKAGGSHHDHTT